MLIPLKAKQGREGMKTENSLRERANENWPSTYSATTCQILGLFLC